MADSPAFTLRQENSPLSKNARCPTTCATARPRPRGCGCPAEPGAPAGALPAGPRLPREPRPQVAPAPRAAPSPAGASAFLPLRGPTCESGPATGQRRQQQRRPHHGGLPQPGRRWGQARLWGAEGRASPSGRASLPPSRCPGRASARLSPFLLSFFPAFPLSCFPPSRPPHGAAPAPPRPLSGAPAFGGSSPPPSRGGLSCVWGGIWPRVGYSCCPSPPAHPLSPCPACRSGSCSEVPEPPPPLAGAAPSLRVCACCS